MFLVQMTGTVPFHFTMEELTETFGRISGKELHFKVPFFFPSEIRWHTTNHLSKTF